jgi:uncharacterized protein YceH (UPF0502 family)
MALKALVFDRANVQRSPHRREARTHPLLCVVVDQAPKITQKVAKAMAVSILFVIVVTGGDPSTAGVGIP